VGLEPDWLEDVLLSLDALGVKSFFVIHPELTLLEASGSSLVLNLVSTSNLVTPELLLREQHSYHYMGILMVHLWEDVWLTRKPQVLGRIYSLLGLNKKIHARKTQIGILDHHQAEAFLSEHHLQGAAKARYKFSLIYEHQVVAVAAFSGTRLMKYKAPGYRSSELIRFASKTGFTVTGGLTKLIRHYINLVKPNDLMSYADRDWSQGKAYESLGFTLDSIQGPSHLWLNITTNTRYFPHRLPPAVPAEHLVQIFNTGNLKYILYL
jgi:hypothetical protein